MSTEALVLALSAVIRPTSVAAVAAMLTTRRPQGLLAAYVLAGMAFSLAVGTLVVGVLAGVSETGGRGIGRPLLDTSLGAAALAYDLATSVGWIPRPSAERPNRTASLRRKVQQLSPSGAAMAGVLTHLPGLVYLAALNAIAAEAVGTLDHLVQVVVYNVIWFSVAIAALVLSVHRPGLTEMVLAAAASWVGRHRRGLVAVLFGAVGGYLVVAGVAGLTGANG